MKPAAESSVPSPKRRLLIGWGSIGVVSIVAGLLGWRTAQKKDGALTTAGPHPTQPAKPKAATPGADAPAEPPSSITADRMTREWFLPHLGTAFKIDVDGFGRDCKLVNVSEAQTLRAKDATYTAFSLMFESHAAYRFESRIYRIKHEAMGDMDLFLSQIGLAEKHSHLEAVFSQRM